MRFVDAPVQRKLMYIIMMTSGAVLLLTCASFFTYEFVTFRQTTVNQLSILGKIIGANSTAALAFNDRDDAAEILSALRMEENIKAAGLYDQKGNLFSRYPQELKADELPEKPGPNGYEFVNSHLAGFEPVYQGDTKLGTLYLKADMNRMFQRFRLYGGLALLIIALSFLLAYFLSGYLQKKISEPILSLASTAKQVSVNRDYTVRAKKLSQDETGMLTDAFNQMLTQIEMQNKEIMSFNLKLERKVRERTNELEYANKELEAFSYSVSHDLRAPLRHIEAFISIFLSRHGDELSEEGRKLINRITGNTTKMGQLIDDLLAFAQLGRKELEKENVNMTAMAAEVWEEMRKEDDQGIEFILHDMPEACADPVTMKQVWMNLLSNAKKYSRNKEKVIIEAGVMKKDGEDVYYVRDNGAGFDMKFYKNLFAAFQRLHTTKDFEGTGVGLAIVQRIIQRHGGKIWAEGKEGVGATFYFTVGAKPGEREFKVSRSNLLML